MKQKLVIIASVLMLALSGAPEASGQWVQTKGPPGPAWFASEGPYLFAISFDGFYRSTDSGVTYSLIPSSVATELVSHPITIKDSHIYVAHINGVFQSADSGKTWVNDTAGLSPDNEGDIAIIDSTVVVAWHNGTIFRSSDRGRFWSKMNLSPKGYLGSLVSMGSTGFLTDSNVLYQSINDGLTWTVVNTSFHPLYLATNGKWLFAGGADGFYRSQDSGVTWQSASNGLGNDSSNIGEFASNGQTIVVAEPGTPSTGYIYLSNNNGASWLNFGSVHRLNGLGVIGDYAIAGSVFGTSRRSLLDTLGLSNVSVITLNHNHIAAFPNPFSQSTTITFSSPESGVAEVTVVNLLGTQVARLFEGELAAGEHTFTWNAAGIAPGAYWCVVRMNGRVVQVPIVLE